MNAELLYMQKIHEDHLSLCKCTECRSNSSNCSLTSFSLILPKHYYNTAFSSWWMKTQLLLVFVVSAGNSQHWGKVCFHPWNFMWKNKMWLPHMGQIKKCKIILCSIEQILQNFRYARLASASTHSKRLREDDSDRQSLKNTPGMESSMQHASKNSLVENSAIKTFSFI